MMPFIDILHTNPHKYTHNNDRFQFSKHLMSFFSSLRSILAYNNLSVFYCNNGTHAHDAHAFSKRIISQKKIPQIFFYVSFYIFE